MFISLKIDYAKLRQPIQFQCSFMSPAYVVRDAHDTVQISLRERKAYPGTFCRAEGTRLYCGYGSTSSQDLAAEFLHIALEADGTLFIERDICCTLPLFYAFENNQFVLSNDYTEVVESLDRLTPDEGAIARSLIGRVPHSRSLWREIHTLEEREKLRVDRKGVHLESPPGRQWQKSADAPYSDPHSFISELEMSFSRLLSRITTQSTAFELSGGIDSSTFPLYVAKYYPGLIKTAGTMLYPGKYQTTQQQKLDMLACVCRELEIVKVPMRVGTNHPLARIIGKGENKIASMPPLQLFLNVYHEPTEKLAQLLADRGVSTVITGIGGDELFEHWLSPASQLEYRDEVRQEYLAQCPPYVTDRYRQVLGGSIPNASSRSLGLLSVIFQSSVTLRNNTYIEQGIWPISQFADPRLYEFCQGLPIHFRANKNILRAYHQAHDFPATIYHPLINEDFEEFFVEALSSGIYDSIAEQLLDNSITVQKGYVNKKRFWDTYLQSTAGKDVDKLFYLYCWICAELELQFTGTER